MLKKFDEASAEVPLCALKVVTDPKENAAHLAALASFERNCDWLSAHWAELLPQVLGKYLAVANEKPHIGDSLEEVRAWVAANHPDDPGPLLRRVSSFIGDRIYAHRG